MKLERLYFVLNGAGLQQRLCFDLYLTLRLLLFVLPFFIVCITFLPFWATIDTSCKLLTVCIRLSASFFAADNPSTLLWLV